MLLLRRLLTAALLTGVLFLLILVASLAIGGAVAGARAPREGATDFHSGMIVGARAGQQFREKYGLPIVLGSAGLSLLISFSLSFSGVFPWCRAPWTPTPPPLPPVH